MDSPLTPRLLLPPDGTGRVLYQGPLRVRRGDELAVVDGEIQFLWRPSPWTRYVCTFDDGIPAALDRLVPGDVSVEPVGAAPVPEGELRVAREPGEVAAGSSYHSDRLPGAFTFGSPDEEVQGVEFHVVNGPNVSPPRWLTRPNGEGWYSGRFDFRGKVWKTTLDVHPDVDLDAYVPRLAQQRALGPTHIGRLERVDGRPFGIASANEALWLLFTTLSFCRGALTGPALPVGVATDGSARWLSVQTFVADEWSGRGTWCDRSMGSAIETLFALFEECWLNDFHREILRRVVRYYVEANCPPVEKGLIVGQAALELLSWAVLVELEGVLKRNKFKDLSAKDKVRRLMEWARIGVSVDAPEIRYDVAGLKAAYPESDGDAPALTTWARNRVGHPERDLPELRGAPLVAAWQLTLFYVELAILRLVDYRGVYSNRLTAKATGEHTQVPWALGERDG